jgi:ATP-dependent exoDNAse (exonuclease V) beta subunit
LKSRARYYIKDHIYYPSVSTILAESESEEEYDRKTNWRRFQRETADAILQKNCDRGVKFHYLMQQYLTDKMVDIDGEFIPLKRWRKIQEQLANYSFFASELTLYRQFFNCRFAGTLDAIAHYNGEYHIIDFKTSSNSYNKERYYNCLPQLAAYSLLLDPDEIYGIKVTILNFAFALKNKGFNCKTFSTKELQAARQNFMKKAVDFSHHLA